MRKHTRRTHVLPIQEAPPEGTDHHICCVFCPCEPGLHQPPDGRMAVFHRDPHHQGQWEKILAPATWSPDLPLGLTPAGGG